MRATAARLVTVASVELTEVVDRSADPVAVRLAIDQVSTHHPDLRDRLAGDTDLRSAFVAVTAASRFLTRLLGADAGALGVLADLHQPLSLHGESVEDLARWKQLELLRIAARDLTGLDELEAVGANLAHLGADVLCAAHRLSGAGEHVAVIGMGKLGAEELNYASDIDVMFVGDGDVRDLLRVARTGFRVDADLRPEGRGGPVIRTLGSYEAYWDRWAQTWEFQALLKARPVAGDPELGAAFLNSAQARVWERPFTADDLRAVRSTKARAEADLARRGLTEREIKRGRGGIRDIEFALQLLQLVH